MRRAPARSASVSSAVASAGGPSPWKVRATRSAAAAPAAAVSDSAGLALPETDAFADPFADWAVVLAVAEEPSPADVDPPLVLALPAEQPSASAAAAQAVQAARNVSRRDHLSDRRDSSGTLT